jgi:hypothetical protein
VVPALFCHRTFFPSPLAVHAGIGDGGRDGRQLQEDTSKNRVATSNMWQEIAAVVPAW